MSATVTPGRPRRKLLEVFVAGSAVISRVLRKVLDRPGERRLRQPNVVQPYLLYPELEDMPAISAPHTL